MSNLNIPHLNDQFEQATPPEILRWSWQTFGPDVAASSAFQPQSLPLLHLIAQTCPELPVIFLDTGFHFPETLAFRDEIAARLGLNLVILRPAIEPSELAAQHGAGLYRRDPDLCCYINKVEPMRRAMTGRRAWISGVRREQTAHRRQLSILEPQPDGLLKIHPLLTWTGQDIWQYMDDHQLPTHPLFSQGYMSIGCAPCTRPIFSGEDERAGRWAGRQKTECGLHMNLMEAQKSNKS